jgi:choline dehydrogenase-like flavoprotein
LEDNVLWQKSRQSKDRDAMGTLPSQPHVEFWNTECYSPKCLFKDFPSDGKYAFAMTTTFFSAKSRGEVTLRSTDPTANPKVQHNYLSNSLDMSVFSEACRLANDNAIDGAGTKEVVVGSWPTAQGHDKYTTRAEWQDAIRERAGTWYYPGGTCMMGNADDEMAVVDDQLRVRGVKNMGVADASIMPLLPSGHPQMAVFTIAEKAADMTKGVGHR